MAIFGHRLTEQRQDQWDQMGWLETFLAPADLHTGTANYTQSRRVGSAWKQ